MAKLAIDPTVWATLSPVQQAAITKAHNEATAKAQTISMKVSEKGGLSVYGLGRFPVTLYKSQWLRLLDVADKVRQFMTDNASLLKDKGE
jgi:hypothetical protein